MRIQNLRSIPVTLRYPNYRHKIRIEANGISHQLPSCLASTRNVQRDVGRGSIAIIYEDGSIAAACAKAPPVGYSSTRADRNMTTPAPDRSVLDNQPEKGAEPRSGEAMLIDRMLERLESLSEEARPVEVERLKRMRMMNEHTADAVTEVLVRAGYATKRTKKSKENEDARTAPAVSPPYTSRTSEF